MEQISAPCRHRVWFGCARSAWCGAGMATVPVGVWGGGGQGEGDWETTTLLSLTYLGFDLGSLHVFSHLILKTARWGRCSPHFTSRRTETEFNLLKVTQPSKQWNWDPNPGLSDSKTCACVMPVWQLALRPEPMPKHRPDSWACRLVFRGLWPPGHRSP